MSAGPIPDGQDPFAPEGDVEILVDSEGVWFKAADVVALLERSGDTGVRQLRELLEMAGG
jgi:prophage antirepressor-like protein